MKKTILIAALSLFALSCGMKPTANSQPVNDQGPSSPELPQRIVDVTQLIGKTKDEAKAIINVSPAWEDTTSITFTESWNIGPSRMEWSYRLNFELNKKNGKLVKLDGKLKGLSAETPEQMANLFGLDIRGVTPSSESMQANISKSAKFYNFPLNGATGNLSIFQSNSPGFDSLILQVLDANGKVVD